MTNIIERAEAALAIEFRNGHPWPGVVRILRDLVTELKAARAENERLRAGSIPFPPSSGCPQCDMLIPHAHEGDPNN